MATIVEHEKRKHEILQRALDVFIDEGYEDVTFQKIADRCGITRTTLYIYFKNKREIFLWSIKQMMENMEQTLAKIIQDTTASAERALREVLRNIISECEKNKKLFSVILVYLIQLQKTGKDPERQVRRRIIRLRHLLSELIIRGIRNGEFKHVSVKNTNEMIYSIIESSIFKLSVLNQENIAEMYNVVSITVDGMTA
ncbi:MAG: TetR/AcrR family transcriptional regulator [Treponemataceae bacterium]|nr:TetR/AcrR family transcriptional regulator [Treponemataceae bacterium]